jgi:uncharacterized protein (DUF2235 family)
LIFADRDTVSSVGIIREKSFPGTSEHDDNICHFRHALALDERRVKFMPEYVCGGAGHEPETTLAAPIPSSSDKPSDPNRNVCINTMAVIITSLILD